MSIYLLLVDLGGSDCQLTGQYYSKQDQICVNCIDNCKVCDASDTCVTCETGFKLQSGQTCLIISNSNGFQHTIAVAIGTIAGGALIVFATIVLKNLHLFMLFQNYLIIYLSNLTLRVVTLEPQFQIWNSYQIYQNKFEQAFSKVQQRRQ
ncbi:unnamed protein product [Paramecium sonneborni]|uniref:Uncharacterized protein n=1 Tax=Paramecium sonneborni TaxID=65129 RepID=A0A8S1QNK3_9CILI|nr:unnamed protein product [Paramecium sonneborni]